MAGNILFYPLRYFHDARFDITGLALQDGLACTGGLLVASKKHCAVTLPFLTRDLSETHNGVPATQRYHPPRSTDKTAF